MHTLVTIHRRYHRLWAPVLGILALSLLATTTRAGDGDELSKVDEAMNRWQTLDYHYQIVTTKAGASPSTIKLRVLMKQVRKKGYVKQYVDILSGDLKGTRVLTRKPSQMYIFLPEYRKIRRIASHMTQQGFLGTALSQRDLTFTRYGKHYDSSVIAGGGETVTLRLKARHEDAPYPALELDVDKKMWLPTAIRYFNAQGDKIKTETRAKYRCDGGYCAPDVMTVSDHTTGTTSTLTRTKWKINPKISKKVFTKRYLHQ